MKIEQNTLSRDWIIRHQGRIFYVNFTESDGQTLALMNRDNWEITEETEDGIEELSGCVFSDAADKQRLKAAGDLAIIKEIIIFCIENWDNEFMQQLCGDIASHADNQK